MVVGRLLDPILILIVFSTEGVYSLGKIKPQEKPE